MLYSSWKPDTGGYRYFASAERLGLGNDVSVPDMPPQTSPIGVPSVDCGRVPSARMRAAGDGELPQGMVMPVSSVGLVPAGAPGTIATVLWVALGIGIGYLLHKS